MRLDKLLAHSGISRRDAKRAIALGRVRVNGETAKSGAVNVDGQIVSLDGERITMPGELYVMLNKPAGYLTAASDSRAPTITQLLPDKYKALGVIGRLDKDVTGLILLTSDGELAHRLISPKMGVTKLYEARVMGVPDADDIARLGAGIVFSDYAARPARLEVVEYCDNALIRLALTEGKFHEVKRLMHAVGHDVISLRRIAIAGVEVDVCEGEHRELADAEIDKLYEAARLERK